MNQNCQKMIHQAWLRSVEEVAAHVSKRDWFITYKKIDETFSKTWDSVWNEVMDLEEANIYDAALAKFRECYKDLI